MKTMVYAATVLALCGLTAAARAEATVKARIDSAAPGFSLVDVEGNRHTLDDYAGSFVVLEWINFDCPFVKKHYRSGAMQRLQKTYGEQGVVWLSICSSARGKQGHLSAKEASKRIRKHKGAQSAYLFDVDGAVGKAYGAKTTPHMFVIDPDGVLIYAGAIDDKPSTDIADVKDAANYVSAALDAALAGGAVAKKSTQPYGCSVKY